MKWSRHVALICAVVLLCALLPAQTPTATAPAMILQQVRLRTPDGIRLDGLVYRPAAQPGAVGLMLVHGYAGNFYNGYFPYLANTAAERGYITLALNMRDHDSGPKISDFTDNATDIATGIAHLHDLGVTRIVLLGQSMGTNRVLYYQAVAKDSTIAATVLVSGPGNLFEWNVWQFGRERAQATVKEAQRLYVQGRGRELMLINMGPLGKALYTPRYLLSLRGPEAKSDPYQNIRKLKTPILILQGQADKLIEPDIAKRLRKAAVASPKVEVVYVDAADHSFSQQQAALAERVLDWMEAAVP